MMASTGASHGSWRDEVLKYFSTEIAGAIRVTVVADPDGLLLDDTIATTLARQGFDVAPYRDAVEFRFYYESRHRARWDVGEHTSIVVSAPWGRQDLGKLPFDVFALAEVGGRVLDISLASIFPSLASDVLAEIDPADLGTVWLATRSFGRESLGGNQTRDLILRAVFKLSPDMITSGTDLVVQLLRLHYAKRSVPRPFASRFAEALGRDGQFGAWSVVELVASPDAFFRMLQDRWERRLAKLDSRVQVSQTRPDGPETVDFAAPEVSAFLDNLFLEGGLSRIDVPDVVAFHGRMEMVGVRSTASSNPMGATENLLSALVSQIPEPNVPPTVWIQFAQRWGELVCAADRLSTEDREAIRTDLGQAQDKVDDRLWEWLAERFGALVNRSFLPMPTVVHQIPHYLAHKRKPGDKVALVIVDGMSLSQWLAIKQVVGADWATGLSLEETSVFAWIPTVTSVSRQAMLAGQAPMFFASVVHTTNAEERAWKGFWEERGWRRDRVQLVKHKEGEHESSLINRVRDATDTGGAECIAVLLNSIDRLVHGAGPEGNVLAAAVRQWAGNGHLTSLLGDLANRGFDIVVCSDHGNVEALGLGRPNLGVVPEGQGQRAILFADRNTLESTHEKVSGTRIWEGPGLPESMHVLLPRARGAFVTERSAIRTHGGASIEEVFVPLVRLRKQV